MHKISSGYKRFLQVSAVAGGLAAIAALPLGTIGAPGAGASVKAVDAHKAKHSNKKAPKATAGGDYTVIAGFVVNAYSDKGAKPNYFGLEVKSGSSAFTNATLAFTVGGTGSDALRNTGTIAGNLKSGTFSGAHLNGAALSGSFTG